MMPNSFDSNTSAVGARDYECRDASGTSGGAESASQPKADEVALEVRAPYCQGDCQFARRVSRLLEHPHSFVEVSRLGWWYVAYDGESGLDVAGSTAHEALRNLFAEIDAQP